MHPQRPPSRILEAVYWYLVYLFGLGFEFATRQEWQTATWTQAKKLAGDLLEGVSACLRKSHIRED